MEETEGSSSNDKTGMREKQVLMLLQWSKCHSLPNQIGILFLTGQMTWFVASRRSQNSFSILPMGYCHVGDTKRAYELYREMDLLDIKPTNVTYTTLISAVSQEGSTLEVDNLQREMVEKGIVLDVPIYNALIHFHAMFGDARKAFNLYEEMTVMGLVPKEMTQTSLLAALCREGKLHDAYHHFTEMKAKGFTPSSVGYATLVHCCCKLKDYDHASDLCMEMIDEGHFPQIATCNELLIGLRNLLETDWNSGNLCRVSHLVYTYVLLITLCSLLFPSLVIMWNLLYNGIN
ncbi:hypothetical protein H6P81_015297 [Aristolochia fimbriata]|uniref:Pentatricopeptide repeat-containing protein n=1 Tax=Aristolochia fimbriata TaxID=158543 RepID=A0AAV7E875_ARIFI|nr:hypothetical protein H6P81_015297 [Aristolochia fimbriata]